MQLQDQNGKGDNQHYVYIEDEYHLNHHEDLLWPFLEEYAQIAIQLCRNPLINIGGPARGREGAIAPPEKIFEGQ